MSVMATKKELRGFIKKRELNTINDPYELLADVLLENIRLRREITECKCKCCLRLYIHSKFLIN